MTTLTKTPESIRPAGKNHFQLRGVVQSKQPMRHKQQDTLLVTLAGFTGNDLWHYRILLTDAAAQKPLPIGVALTVTGRAYWNKAGQIRLYSNDTIMRVPKITDLQQFKSGRSALKKHATINEVELTGYFPKEPTWAHSAVGNPVTTPLFCGPGGEVKVFLRGSDQYQLLQDNHSAQQHYLLRGKLMQQKSLEKPTRYTELITVQGILLHQ